MTKLLILLLTFYAFLASDRLFAATQLRDIVPSGSCRNRVVNVARQSFPVPKAIVDHKTDVESIAYAQFYAKSKYPEDRLIVFTNTAHSPHPFRPIVVLNGKGFEITSRSLEALTKDDYLKSELNLEELKGLKVLDVGSGGIDPYRQSNFAIDLIRNRINTWAVDIFQDYQVSRCSRFVTADCRDMPFQNAFFDRIFSNYTVFRGLMKERQLIINTLREFVRVLKPNGRIHIAGLTQIELLETYLDDFFAELNLVIADKYMTSPTHWTVTLKFQDGL